VQTSPELLEFSFDLGLSHSNINQHQYILPTTYAVLEDVPDAADLGNLQSTPMLLEWNLPNQALGGSESSSQMSPPQLTSACIKCDECDERFSVESRLRY
jgi:hypothetical protein